MQSFLLQYSPFYFLMPLFYPDQCSLSHKKWIRHEMPVSVAARSGSYPQNIGVKPTLLTHLTVYDIHPLFFKLLSAA